MNNLFTIVIPCKNEEGYIDKLLYSLQHQTLIPKQIIIADNNSTDQTIPFINYFKDKLNIQIIQGGNVSFGRNQGAKLVDTKYIIFIDADMELIDNSLLDKTIQLMEKKKYDMCTTNLKCVSSNNTAGFIYFLNNISQRISKLINSPFSTGAFMCITKTKFDELGGFDQKIQFSEDYWLSKQISGCKFGIINSNIYTSDRRFKKMGYWWMIKNFIKSYINRNNREYFLKDFKYWD